MQGFQNQDVLCKPGSLTFLRSWADFPNSWNSFGSFWMEYACLVTIGPKASTWVHAFGKPDPCRNLGLL